MVPKISALDLVDAVYLMTLLADHPRSIDRYIDYFGSDGGASIPAAPRQQAD